MAYMGGGIADMLGAVDKTAGVFAGNPQKLKQKAGPNLSQDLISALALQKITSEKAAAERDMQMQMEQNPATIAEQLEQKATQQSQQEVAKQVGQIGQQKQQRQQKTMQKLAGQMGKPKPMNMQGQQQRPQGTGIAQPPRPMAQRMGQGLPQAPRPPMPQVMNTGGIVWFNDGGKGDKGGRRKAKEISDAQVDKFIKANYRWDPINQTYFPRGQSVTSGAGVFGSLMSGAVPMATTQAVPKTREEIKAELARSETTRVRKPIERQARRSVTPVLDPSGGVDQAATDAAIQAQVDKDMLQQFPAPTEEMVSGTVAKKPPNTMVDALTGAQASPAAGAGGDPFGPQVTATPPPNAGGLQDLSKDSLLAGNQAYQKLLETDVSTTQPTYTQTPAEARDEALKAAGLRNDAGVNPQNPDNLTDVQRRAAEEKRVQNMMGLKGIEKRYKDNRTAQEKILAERDDADRLKGIAYRQGLKAFKDRGTGGYASGRDAAEGAQFAGRLKGQQGLETLDQNFATNRINIGKEGAAGGRTQQVAIDANRQTIMKAFENASADEVRRAEKKAEIINEGVKNNLDKLSTLTGIESDAQGTAATRGNKIAELNQEQAQEAAKLLQTIKKEAMELAQKTVKEREDNAGITGGMSAAEQSAEANRLFLAFYANYVDTEEALQARIKEAQSNLDLNRPDINKEYGLEE